MYLPDTNVFIRGLHGKEPDASFLKRVIEKNHCLISAVVVAEFLVSADHKAEEVFRTFMSKLVILSVDTSTAEIAAAYRKELKTKTKRVIIVDCFLAAQAKQHNLTLVTNNRADFPMKDIRIIAP